MKRIFSAIAVLAALATPAYAYCPNTSGWVCNARITSILPADPDECAYIKVDTESSWYAIPLMAFGLSNGENYPDETVYVAVLNQQRLAGDPVAFFINSNLGPDGSTPICSNPWPILTHLQIGVDAKPQ